MRHLPPSSNPRASKLASRCRSPAKANVTRPKPCAASPHNGSASPRIGGIPGQIGHATYGVVSDAAHGIRYLTGIEVSGRLPLPGDLSQISIPAHRFAVFTHSGDVSTLHDTIDQIWRRWLPESGHEAEPGAAFFERYGDDFDPRTGTGNVEIWVAVKE